ncbi:MAG: hypothetical protein BIFFINMI_01105 [Phycisphaerae bacterium]|nr:hypothetical protein [Phycisphaerae bacterium]
MVSEIKEPRPSLEEQGQSPAPRRRRAALRAATGSVLPTLATLGNLVCGFGAIYCAARASAGAFPRGFTDVSYFTVAGWLIFLAMVFDALDGRLARMTRSTSDLGAQLDSLSDVVSFGVAPAMLMLMLIAHYLNANGQQWFEDNWLLGSDRGIRIAIRATWVIAALFACCAALRLARFNVETTEDEAAHLWFKGLPSPGAAAALASLVLLMEQYIEFVGKAVHILIWALPVVALCAGLMMVANVPYPHAMTHFGQRRYPFGKLVLALLAAAALLIFREKALVVASVGYVLSGPLLACWRRYIRRDQRSPDDLAAVLVDEDELESQ